MIVRREARAQTTEGEVRSYRKQHSCVQGSDRITPGKVKDIEIINEEKGFRGLMKQVNQIIPCNQHTRSKQNGDEYEQPQHVAGYGGEYLTRAPSDGAKCPQHPAHAGHESWM